MNDEFWAQVKRNGECLEWQGPVTTAGYGRFGAQGYAHRIAWKEYYGVEPKNFVCHTCDNRICLDKRHLFDGTPKENSQDAAQKGKMGRKHRLTWHERNLVRLALQDDRLTQREIAVVFGVGQATVRECKFFLHEPRQ